MLEKSINEKEIINEDNKKELEQKLLNKEEEINNKENNIELYNNLKEFPIDEMNKEKNENSINIKRRSSIMENINNINENSNISPNLELNHFEKEKNNFNLENNLSKQDKEEQTEIKLRNLLSELTNIKQQGNNFFNNKNYEEAEKMYKEGTKK